MVHEKNWRVGLCVQELYHPRDFPWILAAIPVFQNTTGRSVPSRGFRFYLVLDFLVGFVNGSPRSVRSTCELDTRAGKESIPLRSSRARVALSLDTVVVGEVDELEEDVGRSISSWRCHWCWRMRTGGRTRWQARNHDRNEILRVTLYSTTIFNEMWFSTVDPFVRISVFIAKLSER